MARLLPISWVVLGIACSDGDKSAESEPDSGTPPGEVGCGVWQVESTSAVGGHAVTVLGAPATVETPDGPAVCFDGVDDALIVPKNPIEGLGAFTIEVLFQPDADGPAEQRFVHMQETAGTNRALIETRITPEGTWYLDTYLRSGTAELTLVRPEAVHPAGSYYWAALTFDGVTQRHYVDGVEEASGNVAFAPLAAGETSIGVRLNRVSWFKGCVRTLRCSSTALPPEQLAR